MISSDIIRYGIRGVIMAENDYFFLLSGDYLAARTKENLKKVLKLLRQENANFQAELKKFLPASHTMHLRDFKKVLEKKILAYL